MLPTVCAIKPTTQLIQGIGVLICPLGAHFLNQVCNIFCQVEIQVHTTEGGGIGGQQEYNGTESWDGRI